MLNKEKTIIVIVVLGEFLGNSIGFSWVFAKICEKYQQES